MTDGASVDEATIPLSALQHFLYCPRQCALIHVERIWTENVYTAEGRVLHERADTPRAAGRHGVRTVTAMPLSNPGLGIAGVADVVEFHQSDDGSRERAYPVEYKRGRPKAHRADEVQLCAQALCLEAMLGQSIDEGALFYGTTRRRRIVSFDAELRRLTLATIEAVRALMRNARTPPAQYEARRCDACSLIDDCQPRTLSRHASARTWFEAQLETDPCDGS
ncbi:MULTISPECIES: CRISPR-associated protein Cas4 [unclassified Caballeronia]|uniref:CRISPR-associated protein Cas4 n=1 Tax=unclassified Caballeronia TaxID=2646786 RepID=UPI00285B63BD|nr:MULTISPECIES: CRISPR-associated protein Cas4 [unclassified Caballeronia]MDR5749269.1 CRISPR-associated protein Cas4 [Caballeronia sp. LZ024]MDR5843600.1 CRISPR-associated protein Cas4 [Caballeronia sp. LZ031]